MNLELIGALNELERERGIAAEVLIDAIETAIVSAYKKNYGASSSSAVRVELDPKTGRIAVYSRRVVVPEVQDDTIEIALEDALEIDPSYEVGDIVENEVTPADFGRIAAQTAKQVVIQKIREAERSIVYDLYSNREGDVVVGTVQRPDRRQLIVDLGDVEAILPMSEQIPNEQYRQHQKLRFYINEVRQSSRGPQVFLSRTHPGLLRALFELEVPEIQSGEVEIKAVAREAGNRSKVAVYSRNPDIDPVGACVGARGSRVQAVVDQLGNEKIDIIEWVPNIEEFIKNALSPAKVLYVRLDEKENVAYTVVPHDQLSLAIGKEGQNARLAARLTGWRIDIKDVEQAEEFFAAYDIAKAEAEAETELLEEEVVETVEVEDEELREEVEIGTTEEELVQEEPEAVEDAEPASVEISEEELASLTNVTKRKSWQERFGAFALDNVEEEKEEKGEKDDKADTSGSKQEPDKGKKKKEMVITDLSQLQSIDFKFDDEK